MIMAENLSNNELLFNSLLKEHGNALRALSYKALLKWGYTKEEAFQEALVALWSIIINDIKTEHIKAYIYRMLSNREIDKIRKKERDYYHVSYSDCLELSCSENYEEHKRDL